MKTGDTVLVHPHGQPRLKTEAKVLLLSPNQLSIALGFGDPPPFATMGDGIAVHPEHGIVLMASRERVNDIPWGPWVELFRGGHFEIEEKTDA